MRYYPNFHRVDVGPVRDDLVQIEKIINGEIVFGENIRGAFIEAVLGEGGDTGITTFVNQTTGAVTTIEEAVEHETEIRHSLGFVPIGFLVVNKSGPGDIWGMRVNQWTNEILYLGSNVPNLEVRLFVL